MTRITALTLLSLSIALAQNTSMAASADGAIFEFSTRWALRSEPLAINNTRIFRHGSPPQIRLAAVPNVDIGYPLISSDGNTVGVYTFRPCFGSCMLPTPSHSIRLERAGQSVSLGGNELRISRNGRFVFDSGFPNLHPGPYLIDLDTNQKIAFPQVLTRDVRNTLSDEGALLSTEPGLLPGIGDRSQYDEVRLTPFNQPSVTLLKGVKSSMAAITPDGSTVFVVTQSPVRLLALDTQTLTSSTLLERTASIQSISPNRDGSRLLVCRDNELLIWDRNRGWQSLLSHDEGFGESLLTDDGNIAFALTRAGRYFRIDIDTRTAEQLYAPAPAFLSQRTSGAFPGSLVRFASNALTPNTRFTLDGSPLPVIKLDTTFIDLQIPWETQSRSGIVEAAPEDSPFATRVRLTLAERPIPWIVTQTPGESNLIAAAQSNFDALVTPANPAPAGSLIHFYVTGLGPLERDLPTGVPGPTDPPARPLAPIACYLSTESPSPMTVGLRLPTVIYAPNLIGVYQIDAEIPANWPAGVSQIACRGEGYEGTIASIPIR